MTQGLTISKENFTKVILELEDAFRVSEERKMTKGQVELWFRHLKELNEPQLARAVKKIIRSDQFFPSIARILEAAGADVEPAPKALTLEDIKRRQGL